MSLEKLVLILVCVIAAAGLTIWLAALVASSFALPWYGTVAIGSITAMVLYILGRTILERVKSREDDHYDGMKH